MSKSLISLVMSFALALAAPAWAQQADENARKLALAKQYMELADVTRAMNTMMTAMANAMPLEEEMPAPVAKALRESAVESTQAIFPKMVERIAQIYAQAFTTEELESIVAFLSSPAGRAFTTKSNQLMAPSIAALDKEFGPQLEEEMMERLCRKIDCNSPANKRALQRT